MNFFIHTILDFCKDKYFEIVGDKMKELELEEHFKKERETKELISVIKASVYSSHDQFYELKRKYPALTYEVCLSINRLDLVSDIRSQYLIEQEKNLKERKLENRIQKVGAVLILLITFAGLSSLIYLVYLMIRDAFAD
jgi:hypothetical protein